MLKKFAAASLCLAMVLTGCTPASTGITEVQEDRVVSPGTESTEDGEVPEVVDAAPTGNNGAIHTVSSGYYGKYFDYMLSQGGDNLIFSPESFNTAIALYSPLVDDEYQDAIAEFNRNRDYLAYKEVEGLSFANRLWVNSDRDEINFDSAALKGNQYAYLLSMSDSDRATKEKNAYVSDQTDGFITKTPTVLDSDTYFDAMNVLYFKSMWNGGEKELDDYTTEFVNSDETVSNVKMFNDSAIGDILTTENAAGYSMEYDSGLECLVILPDEGASLADVDLDAFIEGNVDTAKYDVRAKFPEFEAYCEYEMNFASFGLPEHPVIRQDILLEDPGAPVISQVAKIKFDHEGTEAAAVTEVMLKDNMAVVIDETPDVYEFIVNRPFIYVIKDTVNDDVAFIGVVRNLDK